MRIEDSGMELRMVEWKEQGSRSGMEMEMGTKEWEKLNVNTRVVERECGQRMKYNFVLNQCQLRS